MPEFVSFSRQDNIGYIILHRPPQNRANRQFVSDLGDSVREAALAGVRAVVVKAEGPDFCLGGDFREWPTYSDYLKRKERWTFSNGILSLLETLPVPTIAAIHGRAYGFGFEIALHTDLIVAADSARFRFPEATIGVFPLGGGAQRIADRAGRSVAARLSMLSEEITAEDAKAFNIITHLVPETQLKTTVDEIAEKLAAGPTRAHAATKAVLSAWSAGGIPAADMAMIENIPGVLATQDVTNAIASAAEALATGRERPTLRFRGD
jgi:enoyl-CoA hydratase/carnithine racemase